MKPEWQLLQRVGPYVVSTVLLPLEHPGGMWFETMVFRAAEKTGVRVTDYGDLECHRYRTKAEAIAGHDAVVELVRVSPP